MKTIFLSFDKKWYPPLRDGRKKYEHRKRFCNESTRAFLYIGKPVQAIVAEIGLGERESLEDIKEKYKNNITVTTRIDDFLTRNNYAMKVLWFKEIVPIELNDLLEQFPDFSIPRSYLVLENKPKIMEWLDATKRYTTTSYQNHITDFDENNICTY